jgi:hypothetical protein
MSDMDGINISVWNGGARNENLILYNMYVSQIISKQRHSIPPWDLPAFHVNTTKHSKNNTQIKKPKYMMSWE